jgi:NADH-quinone oxidoreductase subunit H
MLKEDFTPAGVKKIYFWLAPAVAVIPAMLVVAVIPFGSQHRRTRKWSSRI